MEDIAAAMFRQTWMELNHFNAIIVGLMIPDFGRNVRRNITGNTAK